MKIIIPGNTIVKKNSQRIIKFRRKGARRLTRAIAPSLAYEKWEESALASLLSNRQVWQGTYPVELKLFYYRENARKFDLSNLGEGVQDVLVKAGVLIDDSMKYVVQVIDKRGKYYGWDIDKENPRVEIKIQSVKN